MASAALGIGLGLLGGLGGLFGNRPKTYTTDQTGSSTGTTDASQYQDFYSNPTYDPYSDALRRGMIQNTLNYMQTDPDLTGYTAQGLQQINQSGSALKQSIADTLASRGLSYSPIAGSALTSADINRVQQGNQFINQIPLLRQQLQQQKMSDIVNTFRALPYGTSGSSVGRNLGTQSQNFSQHGTSTDPGNQTGGFLAGLGGGLGFGVGKGLFKPWGIG